MEKNVRRVQFMASLVEDWCDMAFKITHIALVPLTKPGVQIKEGKGICVLDTSHMQWVPFPGSTN